MTQCSAFAKKKVQFFFNRGIYEMKATLGGKFRCHCDWELGYDGSLSTKQVWKTLLSHNIKAQAKL